MKRRLTGGGKYVERDRATHGSKLLEEAEQMQRTFGFRKAEAPEGIQPRLIFKLQLHPRGQLDDDAVAQLGLRLTAREPGKAIVVFPNDETLEEFRRRLGEYVSDGRYKGLGAIEEILPIDVDDRVGPVLKRNPLTADESAALDVELWHTGRDESREQIDQLQGMIEARGGRVTDFYVGDSLCLMRAHLSRDMLEEVLQQDFVRQVDRRPTPSYDMLDVLRLGISDLEAKADVNLSELTGVVVLDSGVVSGHPLLASCIGDAQDFTSDGNASDVNGHGTAVAGFAAYGDVARCIDVRLFDPSAAVFSARILNSHNLFDEDRLVENQLGAAVDYFIEQYPTARVFNLSLGASDPGDTTRHQFRIAAALDEIAFAHRDREIVVVVPTGNFFPGNEFAETVLEQYPDYLLDNEEARLVDPATAAIPLTVGGLSFGLAKDFRTFAEEGIERPVAGQALFPSPFSRAGPGVQGSIKPELVDIAGDLSFERGRFGDHVAYVGVPTLNQAFGPPDGRLLRTVAGTSFAAPRVANLAARLFTEFPGISSNMVRALIACAAELPAERPPSLHDPASERTRRLYGYGVADFERASSSARNDALLLYEGTIPLDEFQLFVVPPIPEDFMKTSGDRILSVALAFDPPTRHTRADSYLGVTMQFALYRNVTPDDVADGLRVWAKGELSDDAELPDIASAKIDLQPGVNLLKKGCLQKASYKISRPAAWHYNGEELVLAVICRRKWAPTEVDTQRYAVAVEITHSADEVDLHTHIRQQVRLYERVRVTS